MSRLVGPYRIEQHLGRGGLGDVFRARDERLGRDVALKVLPAAIAESPTARNQLFSDAFLASSLEHPGIARVYDIGEHDGQPYLAFEFVDGQTLAERLSRGPLPVAEAVTMAIAISDALADAHAHGVVHRDLKPANVMITRRGRPKILDFGLSGWTAGSDRTRIAADPMAAGAATAGTVQYFSPEQALGDPGDARSDVFSLGAILHEMVTGRRAFYGRTPVELVLAILKSAPIPPSRLNPSVPASLDAVVAGCLAKSLDARTPRATLVGDALRELAHEPLRDTRPPSRSPEGPRRAMRRGAIVVALTAGMAATAAWFFAPGFRAAVSRLLQ
jgi:serine/threonine protein kinase